MKKHIRKERIKSVILVLLILNCLQFMGQIWFNKKLWPSGYNFFDYVKNISPSQAGFQPGNGSGISSGMPSHVKKIVINGGDAREVYLPGQKQYETAYFETAKVLEVMLKTSPRFADAEPNDWERHLTYRSIYLDFGYTLDAGSFAAVFLPGETPAFNIGNVSSVIITGDEFTKEGIVYILDLNEGVYTKYFVDSMCDDIFNYIKSATLGRAQNKQFPFELRFPARQVVFESTVLLNMFETQTPDLIVANPLRNDPDIFDRMVQVLGYTPSALRKKVYQDGATVYVENSATIKIYPEGLLEYTAFEPGRGIPMQEAGNRGSYHILSEVTRIVYDIWRSARIDSPIELGIASDMSQSPEGEIIIEMNYIPGGTPVILPAAVEARVQNGYIDSFKMTFRSFEFSEDVSIIPPALIAVDALTKEHSDLIPMTITDIFICYNGEIGIQQARWGARIKNRPGTVLINE